MGACQAGDSITYIRQGRADAPEHQLPRGRSSEVCVGVSPLARDQCYSHYGCSTIYEVRRGSSLRQTLPGSQLRWFLGHWTVGAGGVAIPWV